MKIKHLKLILKEIIKEIEFMNEISYDIDDEPEINDDNYGGWLDPNGKFHAVKFEEHRYWAEAYLKKMGYNDIKDVYNAMYKLGFVRVVKQQFGGDTMLSFQYTLQHPINSKQLKAIKDLSIEEHCDYLVDETTHREMRLKEVTALKEAREPFVPNSGEVRWWMDTKGKIYDVSKVGHSVWGAKYITDKYGKDSPTGEYANSSFGAPYELLFGVGWVRLLYIGSEHVFIYEYDKKHPSMIQMSNIKKLAKKYGAKEIYNQRTLIPEPLYEDIKEDMSYDDLLKLTTPERKDRASNVTTRSLPVSTENGLETWNFRYKSSPQTTTTDKPFRGSISFIKGNVGQNDDAMKMKCKVDCECPDFMYRFAYNDASKGASQVGPDSLSGCANRRPKPAYDYGEGLCKHLTALGRFLKTKIQATKKSNLFEALDDITNQGPFNVTYYD